MKKIPLTAVPNQAISFNAGSSYWKIRLYQNLDMMNADISRDGVIVCHGVRCFGGIPLLQYSHQYRPDYGNFVFDRDADWTLFGDGINLFYLDGVEFAEYQALATRKE
ncbi:DNA polymerase [Pseudomonas phage EPa61]|jgi:hypothetical protein|uniref:Cyanophage baseplate Pam3 plug gp18 domain-containing protein n=39 Tax=root TaxID=1 RepID=A0A1J0MHZ8_9CAUD|nr:virion structural protein [Pseudomonas phage F8]YP_002154174.1 virion structural protein [Pseudomonas phage LBL3]YP_002455962.1 virion structural protein [Pseudomonas phage PB1]YP_009193800.1 virion structural protein [Pseudomonas phage DL60]YP_009211359.1 virion structural protein [Pseudomonas phage vB_Pae_PS44]YP_009597923.1 virion structural protein [Pseudomonas phage PA5]YP_009833289.1 virion structural protein [Pseudomonas phage R26]YP_009842874.1 virion structural protein [Pseudomon